MVNNKVAFNGNKKTEKLVCLLLLTPFFSGVVNRRACLRDVTTTNFYMPGWAGLAARAAIISLFEFSLLLSSCSGLHMEFQCSPFYIFTYLYFDVRDHPLSTYR